MPSSVKPGLQPYTQGRPPITPGGDSIHTQNEMSKIATAINNAMLLIPQPAIAAPKNLADGMIRLSRQPWQPVAGTTTDAWVYYDASGGVWRLLSTAPTNS